ncbi:hypothetical protein ACH5RR_004863 [Cinchona calisaya]|uniref:MBD domain-containing protein n=1 Tax=Cinchona calisaya TaxID=153742 RepID=A0ABD3AYR7_9GENT
MERDGTESPVREGNEVVEREKKAAHNITSGLEIAPFVNLSGTTELQNLDSQVQERMESSYDGLEKAIVLSPNPLSVYVPENVVRPQLEEQKTIRRRRCLTKAKVVSVSYASFHYSRSCGDPTRYDLGMYEVGSVPEAEGETPGGFTRNNQILPFPGLLKNWKREIRERPSGAQDKFYFHPKCKKMLRSLVEVTNFVKTSNNLPTTFNEDTNLSEASILPKDNKRKNNGSAENKRSKSKKMRIFPVSPVMKNPRDHDKLAVEEFLADAYRNLMNLTPTTPDEVAIEEEEKINVEAFLHDAHQNLLKGFDNKQIKIDPTKGSSQNASSDGSQLVQNLEPSKPQEGGNPEPLIPQQGGEDPEPLNAQKGGNANADNYVQARMDGLTEKEVEVVKIFSEGGLGRVDNDQHQQDEEEVLDYSHLLFEPVPPPLF